MDTKLFLSLQAAVAMALAKTKNMIGLKPPIATGTPSYPSPIRHSRTRAHAPNDGHWHMKFHRSRAK